MYRIFQIGPDTRLRGGIASVIATLISSPLNMKYRFEVIASRTDRSFSGFIPGLARYISQKDLVDLVHVHVSSGASIFRKSAFVYFTPRNVPLVLHVHSGSFLDRYKHCGPVLRKLVLYMLERASRVVVVSPTWYTLFCEVFPDIREKLVVIPNPVDMPCITTASIKLSLGSRKRQVLYMGGFVSHKGLFDLLKAIPIVLKRHPDVRFVLAGSGETSVAEEEIRIRGLDKSVDVVGWVQGNDKERLLLESSILVAPSHHEAFGITVVEGMSYGLSIVATAVGGIRDIVKHGRNGLLCKPKDPVDIANAISALLDDDRFRTRTALLNIRCARKYAVEAVSQKVDELYESLLG